MEYFFGSYDASVELGSLLKSLHKEALQTSATACLAADNAANTCINSTMTRILRQIEYPDFQSDDQEKEYRANLLSEIQSYSLFIFHYTSNASRSLTDEESTLLHNMSVNLLSAIGRLTRQSNLASLPTRYFPDDMPSEKTHPKTSSVDIASLLAESGASTSSIGSSMALLSTPTMGTTSSVESEMKENKMAKKEEKASDSQETTAGRGKRKTRRRKRQRDNPQCRECGTKETPEWRRGPDGNRTLCNACGLHYAKQLKKKKKAEEQEKNAALTQGARFSYSLPAHAGTMQTPSPSAFNAVSPLASPPSSTSSGVSSLGPFRINSGVLTSSHQLQQLQQSQPLTMVTSGLSFPTSSSAVTPMLPGPASQPSRLADPFSLQYSRGQQQLAQQLGTPISEEEAATSIVSSFRKSDDFKSPNRKSSTSSTSSADSSKRNSIEALLNEDGRTG